MWQVWRRGREWPGRVRGRWRLSLWSPTPV